MFFFLRDGVWVGVLGGVEVVVVAVVVAVAVVAVAVVAVAVAKELGWRPRNTRPSIRRYFWTLRARPPLQPPIKCTHTTTHTKTKTTTTTAATAAAATATTTTSTTTTAASKEKTLQRDDFMNK